MSTHPIQHNPHSHHSQHPHHLHKRKLKPHHHAIRIGSLLGVLFIVMLAFASSRTSFLNLFEKKVNDQTLTGMVAETFPCEPDVTGNCEPQNEAEPCVLDVTGGCMPTMEERPRPEDCQRDVAGGCLPNQPERMPVDDDCPNRDVAGACQKPEEPEEREDCVKDVTGGCLPESEEQQPRRAEPEQEGCVRDVTGGCMPEAYQSVPSEDCTNVDVTGKCFPEKEEPIEQEEPVIPTPRTQTPIPTDSSPAPQVRSEPETDDTPIAFSETGENTETENVEEAPVTPQPPVVNHQEGTQTQIQTQAHTQATNSGTQTHTYTALLNVPTKSCLYYDADRPLVLIDINPENKPVDQLSSLRDRAIVILSRTYVKGADGSRTYIIDGNQTKSPDSNAREFLANRNIIRRDAGKLEMLIHCLEVKPVNFLKQAQTTVSGKSMPSFDDLPRSGIGSWNDALIYSTAFYDIINGTVYGQNGTIRVNADAQRDILTGEAVKTLVRTRQMILGQRLTEDATVQPWYRTFFDAALAEGLSVDDLRSTGDQPITRGRFAQELLELALMRNMYSDQEKVEALLYSQR